MIMETFIRKRMKKLKEIHPELDEKELERELIPLPGDEIKLKKKVKR